VKLLIVMFILNLLFPQIIGVDIGTQLPVLQMDGLTIPMQDDVIGLIEGYPAKVFIAHDYLAGNHIIEIMPGDDVKLLYSNGMSVEYRVKTRQLVDADALASDIYGTDGLIFQTCIGEERLILKAERK
jgi:hypothetical protein